MFEVIALMLLSQQPTLPIHNFQAPFVEGKASYYTVESSGAITANGERLKDNELTCAMLKGEFGEYFQVVAENGKSVTVRLNDRGPYVKGRVIDLSEAAMKALGPAHLQKVKVYRIGKLPGKMASTD